MIIVFCILPGVFFGSKANLASLYLIKMEKKNTFYMELDTNSSKDKQNHPKPTHLAQEATHAHLEYVSLPRLLHHADFQVDQLHSQ
jgi:hypothetical protein